MKLGMRAAALGAGGAAAIAAVAVAYGTAVWDRATAKALSRLFAAAPEPAAEPYNPIDLALLPAPVQRYFEFALQPGRPLVRRARLVQTGMFCARRPGARWSPFAATQHFTTGLAGFVWDARIRMSPIFTVRVRDSYISGKAAMQGKIAGLVPVVDQCGGRELAAGALHRYLAEAVWLPTALLPAEGVVWDPVDDGSARATITDHGVSVSLTFKFSESGEIVSCYTPCRYRDVDGNMELTPWACEYGAYARVDGMMIPHQGEARWILPDGPLPYCRLQLRDITYNHGMAAEPPLEVRALLAAQEVLSHAPHESGAVDGGHSCEYPLVPNYESVFAGALDIDGIERTLEHVVELGGT